MNYWSIFCSKPTNKHQFLPSPRVRHLSFPVSGLKSARPWECSRYWATWEAHIILHKSMYSPCKCLNTVLTPRWKAKLHHRCWGALISWPIYPCQMGYHQWDIPNWHVDELVKFHPRHGLDVCPYLFTSSNKKRVYDFQQILDDIFPNTWWILDTSQKVLFLAGSD